MQVASILRAACSLWISLSRMCIFLLLFAKGTWTLSHCLIGSGPDSHKLFGPHCSKLSVLCVEHESRGLSDSNSSYYRRHHFSFVWVEYPTVSRSHGSAPAVKRLHLDAAVNGWSKFCFCNKIFAVATKRLQVWFPEEKQIGFRLLLHVNTCAWVNEAKRCVWRLTIRIAES